MPFSYLTELARIYNMMLNKTGKTFFSFPGLRENNFILSPISMMLGILQNYLYQGKEVPLYFQSSESFYQEWKMNLQNNFFT